MQEAKCCYVHEHENQIMELNIYGDVPISRLKELMFTQGIVESYIDNDTPEYLDAKIDGIHSYFYAKEKFIDFTMSQDGTFFARNVAGNILFTVDFFRDGKKVGIREDEIVKEEETYVHDENQDNALPF